MTCSNADVSMLAAADGVLKLEQHSKGCYHVQPFGKHRRIDMLGSNTPVRSTLSLQ